jgi:hypothetical protein
MHDVSGEQPRLSAGVREAQMICAEWPHYEALRASKTGSPNEREIPLGAFLGACNFAVEI